MTLRHPVVDSLVGLLVAVLLEVPDPQAAEEDEQQGGHLLELVVEEWEEEYLQQQQQQFDVYRCR